ncbi:MAG: transporter substrate-binding domain-containing protein [Planctomycetes bacterium]|nr:transporter substrate-binding domain-containing protein [Planctomycetota bacterium]
MIEQAVKRGSIRIGMSTFVPWAMRDKNGGLIGFEIDVATQLAKDLGVQVEFVPTPFDGIIPALLAGKFDVIIGGLAITPARNLQVNFTIPYSETGLQLAASRKLAGSLATMADYNDARITLTCRRGSSACSDGVRLFPKATLRQFDDDALCFQEVRNGNAHGVLASEPKPSFWSLQNADLIFMPFKETLTRTNAAFALRKGDVDSLNFLNNWIFLQTRDGFLRGRQDYWFRTLNWSDRVNM